jgi:hypothetical protein
LLKHVAIDSPRLRKRVGFIYIVLEDSDGLGQVRRLYQELQRKGYIIGDPKWKTMRPTRRLVASVIANP